MSDYIELISIAGSGGFGYLIKHIIDYVKERKAHHGRNRFIDGMRQFSAVSESMETLKNNKHIDRVLLIEVSNGGNTPKAGSKMYARAVTAKHENPYKQERIIEKYGSILIDDHYINMCIEIGTSHDGIPYAIDVNSFKPCLLRNFYEVEGIKYSEVYHIFTDSKDKKMFILSVATQMDGEKFNKDSTRALINSEISTIRTQFEKRK